MGVTIFKQFDDASSEETPCLWADLWRESRGMSWSDLDDTPVAPVMQMFVKSLTGTTVSVHARVSDSGRNLYAADAQTWSACDVPAAYFRRQAA